MLNKRLERKITKKLFKNISGLRENEFIQMVVCHIRHGQMKSIEFILLAFFPFSEFPNNKNNNKIINLKNKYNDIFYFVNWTMIQLEEIKIIMVIIMTMIIEI